MVFRKKKMTMRRKFSKSRTKGTTGWMGIAKKALRTAKYVSKLVNAESKYYETTQSTVQPNYNGIIGGLCTPAQGDTVNQRQGDSIKMQVLTIEGFVQIGSGGPELARMIIFIDKEGNIGTSPGNLIENIGTATGVFSNKQQDFKFDSKVILDKTWTMDTYHPLHRFKFVLKVPYHIHYQAATTTVKNNALSMLLLTGLATNGSAFTYHTHVTYLDN